MVRTIARLLNIWSMLTLSQTKWESKKKRFKLFFKGSEWFGS